MKNILLLLVILGLFLFVACEAPNQGDSSFAIFNTSSKAKSANEDTKLDDYWYQGKAEINSYQLEQARYSDMHPGEAVLVFVTEDFLTDKQVKNDNYTNKNSTPILKNNFLRKFTTGIYDYSIMTSIFTPTETSKFPRTQKITISSQDWCGQSFMQINQQKNKYKVTLRSYFESEGDKDFTIDGAMLEDEIFNRIRMNPDKLPTGKTQLIPSATIVRLMHLDMKPIDAVISKGAYTGTEFGVDNLMTYEIAYPALKRKVTIYYQKEAPYIIEGWTDNYKAISGQKMRTKATRKKTMLSPYWQQHGAEDVKLRKDLELTTFE